MSEHDYMITMYHPDQGEDAARTECPIQSFREVWEAKGFVIDETVPRTYINPGYETKTPKPPEGTEAYDAANPVTHEAAVAATPPPDEPKPAE